MAKKTIIIDEVGAKRITAWTLRVMTALFDMVLLHDPHLFSLFYASCCSVSDPPERLQDEKDIDTQGLNSNSGQFLDVLQDLQRQFGQAATGKFVVNYLHGMNIYQNQRHETWLESALKEWQKDIEQQLQGHTSAQEENIDRLAKLLNLNETERRLLIFQFNRNLPGFSALYDVLLKERDIMTTILTVLLDTNYGGLMDAIAEDSALVSSGLLRVWDRPLKIESPSPYLRATIEEPAVNNEAFYQRFVKPLKTASSTSSLARLEEHDREILLQLMRASLPKGQGLHTLIYGPQSVDKLDMLARLFQKENFVPYQVASRKVPMSDLPAWVTIAQLWVEKEQKLLPGSNFLLVIDRAEQALSPGQKMNMMTLFGMEEEETEEDGERASDEGLTSSRTRCIWTTERAKNLSERNLGRFLFHAEVLPGSRTDRRERVEQVISEFKFSQELEHHLSQYSLLGEQQVRQGANLAKLLGTDRPESEKILKRAVHQSQRALGRDTTEGLRASVTHYDLKYLNLEGRFTPEQIVTALKKNPTGNMCFYGLPGAGKTQLAEYLAVELDLPILMRSASDLLNKWLGDTEKNIAGMFAEAENEGALLFLDEADSFLRDRSLARAEWSVTQVNELLQRMERFEGLFIAATNLMRDVDAAALRRFQFKLEFLALKPEQAWEMFTNESNFNPKQEAKNMEELQTKLKEIKNLTPGDFATVKRQANMLGEELDSFAWVEQLAAEAKAKMLGLERNKLGFD